jgi:hypothetical protein
MTDQGSLCQDSALLGTAIILGAREASDAQNPLSRSLTSGLVAGCEKSDFCSDSQLS